MEAEARLSKEERVLRDLLFEQDCEIENKKKEIMFLVDGLTRELNNIDHQDVSKWWLIPDEIEDYLTRMKGQQKAIHTCHARIDAIQDALSRMQASEAL